MRLKIRVWPEPEGTAPKETLTGSNATVALTAESRFSRPAPTMFGSVTSVVPSLAALMTPRSAVLTIADRICQASQSGCAPRTTAAEPARCGAAIEVPLKNAKHGGAEQNAAGIELSTFSPGAITSGLTRKSTSVGPWLEKLDWTFASGAKAASDRGILGDIQRSGDRGVCRGCSRKARAHHLADHDGRDRVPEGRIVGHRDWVVGSRFTMMTPAAPATCALWTFSAKVHTPRATRTIEPAGPAVARAAILVTADEGDRLAAGLDRRARQVDRSEPRSRRPRRHRTVPLLDEGPDRWPTVKAPAVRARAAEPGEPIV